MFTTFNMGIGMMLIADKNDADKIQRAAKEGGDESSVIGTVIDHEDEKVILA